MKKKMISSAEIRNFVNSDDFENIVHGNSAYYKKIWLSWAEEKNSSFIKWNWSAFFFNVFWLLYRKMYFHFLLFLGFSFVVLYSIRDTLDVLFHLGDIKMMGELVWNDDFALFMLSIFVLFWIRFSMSINRGYLKRCLEIFRAAHEKEENPLSAIEAIETIEYVGDTKIMIAEELQEDNKSNFSQNAGGHIKKQEITISEIRNFVNSDDFENIVSENHAYYKKVWLSWAEDGGNILRQNPPSWNWSAFWFSSFWLMYRKMYREFSLFLGILALSNVIMLIFYTMGNKPFMPFIFTGMVWPILKITNGLNGDIWYLRKCLKLVDTANQKFGLISDSPTEGNGGTDQKNIRRDFLQNADGGVNQRGMTIYMILVAVNEIILRMSLLTAFKVGISLLLLELYFRFK